jgi:hypothetical protein
MTPNLVEQINTLDDFRAVRFFQHFNQMLLDGVVDDVDQLLEKVPSSIRTMPEYETIERVALGETEAQLTDVESIAISRKFLEILTQDAAISPLLEKAWETYPTKELGAAKTILSAGLAASSVIIVAASDVEFKVGNDFYFHKPPANPELVKAIVEPFAKAVPGLTNK